MVINGVNFNMEWAQTVKGDVFVKHFLPVVWQDIPEPQRKEKLSEAYKKLLIGEKPVAEERSAVTEQPAETGKPEPTEQPKTTKRAKATTKPEETNEGAE
jgi:hypothetical protein